MIWLKTINGLIPQKVIDIANESRRWAEDAHLNYRAGKRLNGLCAIASVYLHNRLKEPGFKAEIAINDKHCFVLFNHHVIDITATQFGLESVCIVHINLVKKSFWLIEDEFDSADDVRHYQAMNGWPCDQRVC